MSPVYYLVNVLSELSLMVFQSTPLSSPFSLSLSLTFCLQKIGPSIRCQLGNKSHFFANFSFIFFHPSQFELGFWISDAQFVMEAWIRLATSTQKLLLECRSASSQTFLVTAPTIENTCRRDSNRRLFYCHHFCSCCLHSIFSSKVHPFVLLS